MPPRRPLATAVAALLLAVACSRSGLDDGPAGDAGGDATSASDASRLRDAGRPPTDATTDTDAPAGPPPSCAPGGPGLTDCGGTP